MFSIGIDLIEIKRIKRSMKNPLFLKRILGDKEYDQLKGRGFPAQSVAANFCAKEAFYKALGTGFKKFKFDDIQLLRDDDGCPYFYTSKDIFSFDANDRDVLSVSITHTKDLASAAVVIRGVGKNGIFVG